MVTSAAILTDPGFPSRKDAITNRERASSLCSDESCNVYIIIMQKVQDE